MDKKRPYIFGSLEPCYEINPRMWNVFCALTNRPIGQANWNWTEHDVITYILSRGLNRDASNFTTNNGKAEFVESGSSYDIRREVSSNNVLAVRSVSDSDDSCLFVIGT
mgnify:CR=1 FL=1